MMYLNAPATSVHRHEQAVLLLAHTVPLPPTSDVEQE